mmetsp:Transcript_25727/g.18207  ORF Transcript_25727/g.18207 Transcript_25727/m.18207 type:complete len:97 (+) Transcript_25727:54-344(+)
MMCSMLAGSFASTLTNPLDIAKLRMQVQRAGKIGGGDSTQFYYKHLLHGVWTIARDEGAMALLNGSLARIMFHVPMVAISMSVLEMSKPKILRSIE